jgi:hypothetical protein
MVKGSGTVIRSGRIRLAAFAVVLLWVRLFLVDSPRILASIQAVTLLE